MVQTDFVLQWHFAVGLVRQWRLKSYMPWDVEHSSFAVSHYYNIPLAQLLYAGDDVSGEEWDSRSWNTQRNIRYELLCTAIEIVKKL